MGKKKNRQLKHKKIEKKWQQRWMKEKTFFPQDLSKANNPFYNLWMFPYPSAEGLHAGHALSSTGSDVIGRYTRMGGRSVFQPIGYDSFGIHSENFAIKTGKHPKELIQKTTNTYAKQLKSLGHGYDWTKTVTTSDINYYKWTQWLFLQIFKAGLAYRKKSSVNWCPSCKTVLADEQVMTPKQAEKEPKTKEGKTVNNPEEVMVCERCGTIVEAKSLEQWFFRITDYADDLLNSLEKIDWPEKIKNAQRNWIGKSKGAVIKFKIKAKNAVIESFTTRPDTLYGASFFVLAPEHSQVNDVTVSEYKDRVQKYVNESLKRKREKINNQKLKKGVFTGSYVVNPANGKEIPVYIAEYVLMEYGTGAIMGVPAHDARDWQFAKENDLPIVEVIKGGNVKKQAHEGSGKIVNSGKWNGMQVPKDIEKIIEDVISQEWGSKETNYHLRDWIISRQRYWGPPIPMIFCQKCADEGRTWFTQNRVSDIGNQLSVARKKGSPKPDIPKTENRKPNLIHTNQNDWDHSGWWPVVEEDLPVELPDIKKYLPKGEGKGPLADHPSFYEVDCPQCGNKAKRETDVSDTFLDSSWYFLRYPSTRSARSGQVPFDPKITKKWLPVNLYFGGAEHAVLHLMYARFVNMVLNDLELIDFREPFPRFFAHGLMIKDGAKMSKSKGNVVNPDEYIKKYGADTLRLYLMFLGPMDGNPDFRDTGIEGMRRFVERVWQLFQISNDKIQISNEKDAKEITIKMHQTIKKTTEDIENFRYNTAISAIMEFVNFLRELALSKGDKRVRGGVRCAEWDQAMLVLTQLLAPFAPHMTEEAWCEVLGQRFSVHTSAWPKFNPSLIHEVLVTIPVQIDGKLRATLKIDRNEAEDRQKVIELSEKDKNVSKWLKGKDIKDTIFVAGKLVNFVLEK